MDLPNGSGDMADPTYVNVRERQKRVTIAVTRRSEHPHIVRVRGLGRPDKISRIAEMDAVELRPGLAETISADIPPQHWFWKSRTPSPIQRGRLAWRSSP
jgi:hypothetical protein